jgi:aspartyl-tRNA(Asn)/glutamyl-tRNA(Gln) amidotransferase subunit B
MKYEAVVGLEIHAELSTHSKMFCGCSIVDPTQSEPNVAVCPVCAGMPGVLPVVNRTAVEYGIRVGLALGCEIAPTSLFARKNYFYPDLPKGYQISQYESPLAEHGRLLLDTEAGEVVVRVTRVHLEEDTGKLTHINNGGDAHSLVDLNRAGVPLLEIVSEPDMHTVEQVRAYASQIRSILRYLKVNSGDMEKGAIRFEANISIRPEGSKELGTRVEVKNLNSFRALERSVIYEVERQSRLLDQGLSVDQETMGWDESRGVTYTQRSKEEAHDYRYFPEPDLPPLVVEKEWVDNIAASLPELPRPKAKRLQAQYELTKDDALLLASEQNVADYYETTVKAAQGIPARTVANWVCGEIFAWLNQTGKSFDELRTSPQDLAGLLAAVNSGRINQNTAKSVLVEMLGSGQKADAIISSHGLEQISDGQAITQLVQQAIAANPTELASYKAGKLTVANWFFGQVMKAAGGKANPGVVRAELEKQLQLKANE